MSLAAEGIEPKVARLAVGELVREEEYLPTIATVLNRCRAIEAGEVFDDLSCPKCGSHLVASDRGDCLCFDCNFAWRLA